MIRLPMICIVLACGFSMVPEMYSLSKSAALVFDSFSIWPLPYYMDYTGTGNSLNMRHPHVLH